MRLKMRICTKCKILKPKTEFTALARIKKSGIRKYKSWCRTCENLRLNKKCKQVRKRNRAFLTEYKKSHGCVICPEKDLCCLDFHHIKEKKDNKDRAAMWAQRTFSLKTLEKMCDECALLCANCHRKVHSAIEMVCKLAGVKAKTTQ